MENKKYPYEIINKKIKNSKVELIGVKHDFDNFKKYETFFIEKIKSSPEGIVLEQSVGWNFWESEFFGELGEIAYKNNINIYQADPTNQSTSHLDIVLPFASPYLMVFGGLGGSLIGANLIAGSLIGVGTNILIYVKLNKLNKIDDTIRGLITYGETDWRNIKIAQGIEKIVGKENSEKLTAFHGGAHTRPISFYLDHSKIRESKNILYAPWNLIGKNKVRKYDVNIEEKLSFWDSVTIGIEKVIGNIEKGYKKNHIWKLSEKF